MRLCIKFEVNQVDDSGQFLVFLNTWPVFSTKYKLLPANVFRGIILCCRGSSDREVIYRQAVALPKCRAVSISLGMSQVIPSPPHFFFLPPSFSFSSSPSSPHPTPCNTEGNGSSRR